MSPGPGPRGHRHLRALWLLFGFVLPLACAWLGIPPPPVTHSRVTFWFDRGLVFVPVHINHRGPFWMLLDTGTDPSSIDLVAARRAGLVIHREAKRGAGLGPTVPIYRTRLYRLQIGTYLIRNVEAVALNLKRLRARLDRPVDGALGYSFFKDHVVRIDFPRRQVHIYAASAYPAATPMRPGGWQLILPLSFTEGRMPVIEQVYIENHPVATAVDTGSNLTLLVAPELLQTLNRNDILARARPGTALGYGGTTRLLQGSLRRVHIGPFVWLTPSVFVPDPAFRDDWPARSPPAILGNGLLRHFVVTFDYPRRRMILERP